MKKLIVFLCCILIAASVLTGCGTPAVPDEARLLNDLCAWNQDLLQYNPRLVAVDKRQTTVSEKEDLVWVSVVSESEYWQHTEQYQMKYTLYNDGWLLDSAERYSSQYAPTEKFPLELADAEMMSSDYWFKFSFLSLDVSLPEAGMDGPASARVMYNCTREEPRMINRGIAEITYIFDSQTGNWELSDYSCTDEKDWSALLGTYKFEWNQRHMDKGGWAKECVVCTVNAFDGETVSFSMEYCLYDDWFREYVNGSAVCENYSVTEGKYLVYEVDSGRDSIFNIIAKLGFKFDPQEGLIMTLPPNYRGTLVAAP